MKSPISSQDVLLETPPSSTPKTKGKTNGSCSRDCGNEISSKTRCLKEIYETSRYDHDANELVSFALFSKPNPIYFEDALNERKLCDSINVEIQAIEKKEASELVNLLVETKVIILKCIYKTKNDVDQKIERLIKNDLWSIGMNNKMEEIIMKHVLL